MATVTWTGAGGDNLASTGLNWDTASAPTIGDDAVFDGAFPITGSKNCTWDIGLTMTSFVTSSGYVGDIDLSVESFFGTLTLDHNGGFHTNDFNITATNLAISGTSALDMSWGSSVVSTSINATSITNTVMTFDPGTSQLVLTPLFSGSITVGTGIDLYSLKVDVGGGATLAVLNDIHLLGNLALGDSQASEVNGSVISVEGNLTHASATALTGTTAIQIVGSNAQSFSASGSFGLPIEIDKTGGTLTISGSITLNANLTYTAGVVDAGTSEIVAGASITLDTDGIDFYDFDLNGQTVTLGSDLTVTHSMTGDGTLNGHVVYVQGDMTTASLAGTSAFEFSGINTQSWSTSGTMTNSVTINKSLSTLTIGTVSLGGSLTYTAGVVDTSGATFNMLGTGDLGLGTVDGHIMTISGTYNLTKNLNVSGWMTISDTANITANAFTMSIGGSVDDFTISNAATIAWGTSTLALSNVTMGGSGGAVSLSLYNFTCSNTVAINSAFVIDVAGRFTCIGANLSFGGALNVNGTQSVSGTTASGVDSSGGRTVYNVGGTNTDTINWLDTAPGSQLGYMMLMGVGR